MLLVLFLIFLVLKLTGLVMWSWWIICSPLIAVAGFWLLGFLTAIVAATLND